jgi:hypothetical protein
MAYQLFKLIGKIGWSKTCPWGLSAIRRRARKAGHHLQTAATSIEDEIEGKENEIS